MPPGQISTCNPDGTLRITWTRRGSAKKEKGRNSKEIETTRQEVTEQPTRAWYNCSAMNCPRQVLHDHFGDIFIQPVTCCSFHVNGFSDTNISTNPPIQKFKKPDVKLDPVSSPALDARGLYKGLGNLGQARSNLAQTMFRDTVHICVYF